jgi:hypothetical protein
MQNESEQRERRNYGTDDSRYDRNTDRLPPTAEDLSVIQPTIVERLSGFFANLKRKFERNQAKG